MKRTLRVALALLLAAFLTVALVGPAGAQSNGNGPVNGNRPCNGQGNGNGSGNGDYCTESLTTNSPVGPGVANEVIGSGFTPGTTVTVTLGDTVIGTVVVGPDGTFTLGYTTPMTCGTYTITATNGFETQTTTLVVTCTATAGALPYTGNSTSLPLAQLGAGLVAAGALAVLLVRKRGVHLRLARVED
jgi:LPXTG-motif cell wall-anchored protein